ncbi:MAG: sulfatase-like hydrolase/transferase [Bacteroidota bacterium]
MTPHLDGLSSKSIFFTNLYATGTRTVRGLECLSLSIPPVPGQSIVHRPGNENLFSLGALLKSKGYTTQFIYGGYSSFDNMGYYFSHNNYDVIDRTAIPADQVHYANIWGVADEDLFTMALKKLDDNYAAG